MLWNLIIRIMSFWLLWSKDIEEMSENLEHEEGYKIFASFLEHK